MVSLSSYLEYENIFLKGLLASRNRCSLFRGAAFIRDATNGWVHIIELHAPELFHHRVIIFIDPGFVHEVKVALAKRSKSNDFLRFNLSTGVFSC